MREQRNGRGAEKSNVGEGWQTVRRRNLDRRLTNSFFISGFPETTTLKDLWYSTRHLGCLEDVYIARKRWFNNERFGFLRFNNVGDVNAIEKKLNGLIVGGKKLEANFTQVPRPPTVGRNEVNLTSSRQVQTCIKSKVVDNSQQGRTFAGKSFRDVVCNDGNNSMPQSEKMAVPSSK
ncbi:hypothetical protein SSX86_016525 [Deinandra increscens subsp. villosa]|uniref:RRM domain-containing protein n=1 Tax=Deinandra increscens subsp. villosa TaxID=3103831 RepID=A0AAP0GYG6_9ASTR